MIKNVMTNGQEVRVVFDGGGELVFSPELLSQPKSTLVSLRYTFSLIKAEIQRMVREAEFATKKKRAEVGKRLVEAGAPKTGPSGAENLIYLDADYTQACENEALLQYWDSLITAVLLAIDRMLSIHSEE